MEQRTTPDSKYCGGCRTLKASGAFHKSSRSKDGLQGRCAACLAAHAKERLAATPGRTALANRERARAELAARGTKRCITCGVDKEPVDFSKRTASIDGLYPSCKSCRKIEKAQAYLRNREANRDKGRANYEANREARIAFQREWNRRNPEKRAIAHGRRRALKRESTVGPIDLDALWTGRCAICLLPIPDGLAFPDPMSRSVDHIIPIARGGTHEQSNLQWTHLRCNIRKGARLTD